MSGHSKWKTIKHKKGLVDAKRGKMFTKAAKIITIAAREGGGDPDSNFKLRLAMEKAREVNMPKENIKRAIDRGIGKGGDAVMFKEIVYEGFGPFGTAFMVETATDNTNRTNGELRNIFTKGGGNLGGVGAVSYMFKHQGYILLDNTSRSSDEILLEVMEIEGVEDVEIGHEGIEIYTEQTKLKQVQDKLTQNGFTIAESELIYNPKTLVTIQKEEQSEKLLTFIETIEDNDDVQNVFANIDIIE